MQKRDSSRGAAVISVLRSEAVSSVGKEYLELGIDAVLESGVLKDIPLVNTVVGIFTTAGSVRDQLLATKLLRFLIQLSEIPVEERVRMIENLDGDDKFSGRVGASIIEILDRLESEKKPELAAKCFAAYAKSDISYEELRRVLLALERIASFDLKMLGHFATAKFEDLMGMDESLLLSFVNAGLGKNNGGFDGGVIVPTALCKLFVQIGIDT